MVDLITRNCPFIFRKRDGFDYICVTGCDGSGRPELRLGPPYSYTASEPAKARYEMGNVSMLSLTAEQIHERLVERWSNQMTPMVLLSGINLTLAFGSEWANVSSGLGENAQVAFLCISAWAFVLNFMGSLALANMIIWMQRVPEWRMHEFVRDARITRFDVTFNNMSTMSTFVQIGMAFYALHPAALASYFLAFGVSNFFMLRLNRGVAEFGGKGSLNEPQPPPADWSVKTAPQRWLMEDSAAMLAASAELEALLAEALPSMGRWSLRE